MKTLKPLLIILCGFLAAPHRPYAQEVGLASYYSKRLHGRTTASGEAYDRHDFTAAHRTYPFGTYLLVTNLENLRRVVVRVTDRGPHRRNRIIDLSEAAARELHFRKNGLAEVRIEKVPAGIDLHALEMLFPRMPFFDTEALKIKIPLRIGQ